MTTFLSSLWIICLDLIMIIFYFLFCDMSNPIWRVILDNIDVSGLNDQTQSPHNKTMQFKFASTDCIMFIAASAVIQPAPAAEDTNPTVTFACTSAFPSTAEHLRLLTPLKSSPKPPHVSYSPQHATHASVQAAAAASSVSSHYILGCFCFLTAVAKKSTTCLR